MKLVVEYLIIMKSDSFCDSVEAFNKLLQVDSAVSLRGGRIFYKSDASYGYRITGDEIAGKDQRYYHLEFVLDNLKDVPDQETDKFTAFLKNIRGIITRAGGQVETLWDDMSFYYSQRAYPIIHEIENLMRKLIANFMLITIGKEWVSETSPREIQETITKSKRRDYVNVLHAIDFIDLANFLVKAYSRKSIDELYKVLKTANKTEDIEILREYIPKSNWQRYFSKIVDCEDTYLQKRWEELYDLRCMVAHNAIIGKAEYNRIVELSDDLRGKIQEAISKLPQVSVPRDERDLVAENAATNISELYGDFIAAWKLLENRTIDRMNANEEIRSLRQAANVLRRQNQISGEQYKRIISLSRVRNEIVHSSIVDYTEAELRQYIVEILHLIEVLKLFGDDAPDPDASSTKKSDSG